MARLETVLKQYDYTVPASLIAQAPASPRDSARLLVYVRKTGAIQHDTFRHLTNYLPPRAVLVFNETKVIPARFTVRKPTGGKAVLLYVRTEGKEIIAMADRPLPVGETVTLAPRVRFRVVSQEKYARLAPLFSIARLPKVLERYGVTPIPPYIKHTPLSERALREKYQTVFARRRGSVAAPTASLHFTKRLLRDLKKAGHDIVFVTLHVNLGTFAPVKEEHWRRGKLHEEWYDIPRAAAVALNRAKKSGRPIVAVGTTVARTLESAAQNGCVRAGRRTTDLFIRPGYRFAFVDHLITNFHVPQSSLLMLVSAFASRKKILELYQKAMKKRFHFFSFGDGMLMV
ncbi:MAG: tRNA preQ1(34) S-adenosylmethionine ribosyltransferase-isomerase QueA [Patescibacteria group bacterium]